MINSDYYSPLIDANQLKKTLDTVKIFDVRGRWSPQPLASIDAYNKAHIPGAIFLDWTTHFLQADVPTNLAAVAKKAKAQQAFKDLGICKDDTIVLYDDYHHMLAGRVWWSMRYWGFNNVKVLNGGWNNWVKQRFETSDVVPKITPGSFVVNQQAHLKSSLNEVVNRNNDVCLLDARGPVNYQGDSTDPRSGHIQGAINVPFSEMLDEATGLFKDKKSLENLFKQQIVNYSDSDIIASCGSGYAATVVLLALKSMDIEAPLFDDSFSVWKQDESLPIEQGLGY